MTEAEWLACRDHTQLMSHLVWESGGRGVSDRKLRLSACACCRSMWDEFPHEGCRRAVASTSPSTRSWRGVSFASETNAIGCQ